MLFQRRKISSSLPLVAGITKCEDDDNNNGHQHDMKAKNSTFLVTFLRNSRLIARCTLECCCQPCNVCMVLWILCFWGFHRFLITAGPMLKPSAKNPVIPITVKDFNINTTVVPFVYMVFKRVDYMKRAMESLRNSDFPKVRVPLIISHDGAVPEMVEYVQSLKGEFQVIQLFHPYSCYEHPDSFPGNDKSLNENYKGDMFGHPREATYTCCKHHFTWLLKTVFELSFENLSNPVDNFFFMEEDYIVAPTAYSTIIHGLNAIKQLESKTLGGFLGVGLDFSRTRASREHAADSFVAGAFQSGPMTLSRLVFQLLRTHAADYCLIDEYNWDWSLVQMGAAGHLPHTLLSPAVRQVAHIGAIGGMHHDAGNLDRLRQLRHDFALHQQFKPDLNVFKPRHAEPLKSIHRRLSAADDIKQDSTNRNEQLRAKSNSKDLDIKLVPPDRLSIIMNALHRSESAATHIQPKFGNFTGANFFGSPRVPPKTSSKFGGWGHPKDQTHCMELLTSIASDNHHSNSTNNNKDA